MNLRITLAALAALALPVLAHAAPVLMISIDGMRPADVIEADQRGFTVPNLKKIMVGGTWSAGVRNSLPTVTYPNHTTLITGVWPARHGIANNATFDPLGTNMGGWYLYSEDIKVPTLWDAVHASGAKAASLGWPVSVGDRSIDYNVPEYWRAKNAEDLKLVRQLCTPGLLAAVEKKSGVTLADTFGEDPKVDVAKAKFAAAVYQLMKPQFYTVHLAALDESEHLFGPGSAQAKATLQTVDGAVGELVAAARKAEPDLVVVVVSDHGFNALEHQVNLVGDFVDAGLAVRDPKSKKITSWDAMPWGGASAAIVLRDPKDEAVKAKVKALLDKLAADPANGINRIADADEIARMGGTPMASWWIDFKLGYAMGGSTTHISAATQRGTHGWFPEHPEMRASFFAEGPGIPKGKALGEIDQRDIAPTVAKVLKVPFPSADGKPLF